MESTIATLGRNLGTGAKLIRLLAEDGLQDEAFHISINDPTARTQLVQFWNLLAGSSETSPSYQRAHDILGPDFISPQEVTNARGVVYTNAQLAKLAVTLPDKEVLQWARDNGFIVVSGPPIEMNLLDIRDLNSQLFLSKSGGWYADKRQKFARCDTIGANWLVLRKDPVPNSTRKSWDEQQELLNKNERVPNVAEATWGFTTYAEVRGIRLVPNVYVRTSSVALYGNRVDVGVFDRDGGLYINGGSADDGYGLLAVTSARKLA